MKDTFQNVVPLTAAAFVACTLHVYFKDDEKLMDREAEETRNGDNDEVIEGCSEEECELIQHKLLNIGKTKNAKANKENVVDNQKK